MQAGILLETHSRLQGMQNGAPQYVTTRMLIFIDQFITVDFFNLCLTGTPSSESFVLIRIGSYHSFCSH